MHELKRAWLEATPEQSKNFNHWSISIRDITKNCIVISSFIDCKTAEQAKSYVKDTYSDYVNKDNYFITLSISL